MHFLSAASENINASTSETPNTRTCPNNHEFRIPSSFPSVCSNCIFIAIATSASAMHHETPSRTLRLWYRAGEISGFFGLLWSLSESRIMDRMISGDILFSCFSSPVCRTRFSSMVRAPMAIVYRTRVAHCASRCRWARLFAGPREKGPF
jgi:hypothetical protein